MISTLSPHDQEWVLSQRRELAAAVAAGDMTRVGQIFTYQFAEAEDAAAVDRVFRAIAGSMANQGPLTVDQIRQMEAWIRDGLAGLSILEIEDIRERARGLYREATAAADGNPDDVIARVAEIRLSTCSGVLAWMREHDVDHYDGQQ